MRTVGVGPVVENLELCLSQETGYSSGSVFRERDR